MPSNNGFSWDSLFGPDEEEPISSPEFSWEGLFGSEGEEEERQGLLTEEWDPNKELYNNNLFSSTINNAALGVGKVVLDAGEFITDALDTARKSVLSGLDSVVGEDSYHSVMSDVPKGSTLDQEPSGGYFSDANLGEDVAFQFTPPAKAPDTDLSQLREHQNQSSVLRAMSETFSGMGDTLEEMQSVNRRQKTEGGSGIDELQASMGLRGYEGYNPLTMASTIWENRDEIDPIEFTKDAVAMVTDTLGGMAGMAVEGTMMPGSLATKGASKMSSLVGSGMALQTFADTYNANTEGLDDSRLSALGTAAVSAYVQGKVEQLSLDNMMGKGVIADMFKGGKDASRVGTAAVRAAYSALTEGGEEGLQSVVDILAKSVPEASTDGVGVAWDRAVEQMKVEVPESVMQGALFGTVGGGASGMLKLGLSDVDARHAGVDGQEDLKLANSLEKGPTSNEVKELVVEASDLVDSIGENDYAGPSPLHDEDLTTPDPVEPAPVDLSPSATTLQPYVAVPPPADLVGIERKRWLDRERKRAKDSLKKIAKAAQAPQLAADVAIKEEVAADEMERAALAGMLNTATVDSITEKAVAAVANASAERQAKVGQLWQTWTQLSSMVSSGVVEMAGEDENAALIQAPTGATKAEAIVVLAGRAAEMGIALPEEMLQDPDVFDWASWSDSEMARAEGAAKTGLAPLAAAITEAVAVDPGNPLIEVSEWLPEAPARFEAMSSDEVAQRPPTLLETQQAKVRANQLNVRAGGVSRTPGALLYVPDTTLMSTNTGGTPMDVDLSGLIYTMKPGGGGADAATNVYKNPIKTAKWIARKFPQLGWTKWSEVPVVVKESLTAAANLPLREASAHISEVSNWLAGQIVPPLEEMANAGVSPDTEALSGFTSRMNHYPGATATYPGRQMGREVLMYVFGAGAMPSETKDAETAIANEAFGNAMVPWAKAMLFNMWQTSNNDLWNKVYSVIGSGEKTLTDSELSTLGRDMITHLNSQGLYLPAAQMLAANPEFALLWGRATRDVGKTVMGPWSLSRMMTSNGVSPEVASSAVSVVSFMAKRWAKMNMSSELEFWDRLGDKVRLMDYNKRSAMGMAYAISERHNREYKFVDTEWLAGIGKGMVRIFKGLTRGGSVTATLHETMHMLQFSGLLHEMLDQDGRDAIDEMVGAPLWDKNGDPIKMTMQQYEILTMGFEKWMTMNSAPNSAVAEAFRVVKKYVLDTFHGWLMRTGLIKCVMSTELLDNQLRENRVVQGWMAEAQAYKGNGVNLKWGDIKVGIAQSRAFYSLLNHNPDGTEILYGAPGLAVSYENTLANNTGLAAKGVITKESPVARALTEAGEGVGWQIDSARAPDPETEWPAMVGLVNPDSNGKHTEVSLREMEEQRVALGEWSQAVAMSPAMREDEDAEVNKEVQRVMADEAPMQSEHGHDLMMEHWSNVLFAQEKDVYAAGKKVNYFSKEEVKAMLENFTFKLTVWGMEAGKHPIRVATRDIKYIANSAIRGVVGPVVKGIKALEKHYGSMSKKWEDVFEELGMPSEAQMFNNGFAVAKRAEKVAEMAPDTYDSNKREWVPTPGAKSFNSIFSKFAKMADAYWKENESKLPYRDDTEFMTALRRDFRLYLLAVRQKEIEANVAEDLARWETAKLEWEAGKAAIKAKAEADSTPEMTVIPQYPEEPKRPKVPRVTKEGSNIATNVLFMMNARYGKAGMPMFKITAAELTQWENHMVLDKLLSVNMISQQDVDNMTRKGKSHVPLYRIKAAVERSGARNTRIDSNLYRTLDYLKNDISMSVEDPIDSMLRKAQAIEVLTFRQVAKNKLGERIMKDFKWWAHEKESEFIHIFSDKIQITREEYDAISKDPNNREVTLTMAAKKKMGPQGVLVPDGHTFYKHVPLRADQVEEGVQHVLKVNSARAKAGTKAEQKLKDRIDHAIFAFYPEPGRAMYVLVSDKELADSFFYMNNPQALLMESIQQKLLDHIDGMPGAEEGASGLSKAAYTAAKLMHTGYYGGNRFAKQWVIANLQYVVNALPRDVFPGIARSQHGLRILDIAKSYKQSAALLFPTLMEINPDGTMPEGYEVARDAAVGTSTFSGIAASNTRGELSSDVIFELMRSRGRHNSTLSKLWNDASQFLAKEGLNKNLGQVVSELKRGENVKENLFYMSKSPFVTLKSVLQIMATLNENAVRLAERSLTMSEDMSAYPQLLRHYDTSRTIQGKVLAGFNGSMHRAAWEKAKKRLAADPNAAVGEHELPVQFDANQRDHSQSHVTINFAQRGLKTQNLNDMVMFANVAIQDTYTNLLKVAQWSKVRKMTAAITGERYTPLANQARLDGEAAAWMWKSLMLVTLPAIVQAVTYGTGDDDDSLDWQSQSFYEKLSYHWIPVHKVPFSPFKKPLRVASGIGLITLLFRDLPMAAILDGVEVDKKAWGKWGKRFLDGTKLGLIYYPADTAVRAGLELAGQETGLDLGERGVRALGETVLAPEFVNPLLEVMTDKDQFRNRPIKQSTVYDNREPAEVASEKYNILTNTLARKLNFTGLQPAQVQYLVRRYLPGGLRIVPSAANKALEAAVGGPQGVPEDMQPSSSPLVGNITGFLPRMHSAAPWGMSNEFVRDLLTTAREATTKQNTWEAMTEGRKPVYKAQNPIIDPKIFDPLQKAAKMVLEADKAKRYQLTNGDITPLQASEIERTYTLLAHQTMIHVIQQLEGE